MKQAPLIKSKTFIQNCTDHLLFENFNGVINRKVVKSHYENLAKEIEEVGFFGVLIIVKTKAFDGKYKYYIVDGQNRFESIKILGIPFDYQLIELKDDTKKNVVRLITGLNSNSKNWSNNDFLNAYKGTREYDIFTNHLIRNKELKVTDLQHIFLGGSGKPQVTAFKSGEMIFDDEQSSNKMLVSVEKMMSVLPRKTFSRRAMYKAIVTTGQPEKLADAIVEASKKHKKFTENEAQLFMEIMDSFNKYNTKKVAVKAKLKIAA